MKKITILLAIFPLLFSCEKEDPLTDGIVTELGEIFQVSLDANWSTGYHWSWMNRERISIVDTIDFEYIIADPELEGSKGTELWTFMAKSAGRDTLVFMYLPPGASGTEEGETTDCSQIWSLCLCIWAV